jgi:hypothetical protein
VAARLTHFRSGVRVPKIGNFANFYIFLRSNSFFARTDTKRKVDTTPIQIHGTFFYCCGDLFFGLKINHSGYERGSKEISHFFRSRQFYIVFALFNFFFLNMYLHFYEVTRPTRILRTERRQNKE